MPPRANWKGYLRLFAGLLSHRSLSSVVAQRKSEFQSDQPKDRKPVEAAER
jgi:hypothetical protein